ncbi:MAG: hypothetical protein R2850_07470 [Bacteroidia bacterium]
MRKQPNRFACIYQPLVSIDNANSVSLTQNTAITSTGALNLLNGQFRLGNFNFTLQQRVLWVEMPIREAT